MPKVVDYGECPECNCWSLGILDNGRIVRHSRDMGSVEKVKPPFKTTICKGSGVKVRGGSA